MSSPTAHLDPAALPPAQRAALEAERRRHAERIAELEARKRRLEHLVHEFQAALYGKKSEKLDADERQLAFEDLETACAEAEEERAAAEPSQPDTPRTPSARRNLGRLPKELPREVRVLEPESTLCPCGCGEMVRIGEDRSERLDVIPAQFRVIVTLRPKYACPACAEGVHQAPAAPALIPGGLPTEGTLAHVLVAKYADHTPLYRQCQAMSRAGLDLDRSTLAGWVGKAAFHLAPVVERLADHLLASPQLYMDETRAPVLDPGRGRTKTGFLWALARDERAWGGTDPPGVVCFYADSREGRHAERFLEGFSGILQVDAYKGYNRLTRADRPGGPLVLANCWAHARRKLHEVHDRDGSPIAAEGLRRIAELYRIEAEIRGLPPDARLERRQAESRPRVEAFGLWLGEHRARLSAKSRLGEKLAYIANHWQGLQIFLSDGRVDIDSNVVENRIRPLALNRKNALFAGHDEGGRAWGRIASLIETAKMNGVNPHAYLKVTLEAIAAGHPQSRIDDLLPWAFTPASS